jgi:hypothetical protein
MKAVGAQVDCGKRLVFHGAITLALGTSTRNENAGEESKRRVRRPFAVASVLAAAITIASVLPPWHGNATTRPNIAHAPNRLVFRQRSEAETLL